MNTPFSEMREYVLTVSIAAFNHQYGKQFQKNEFDVITIPHRSGDAVAYEVFSKKFKDFFRIKIYCKIGSGLSLSPIILREDNNTPYPVYVTEMILDRGMLYLDKNEIRQMFHEIEFDPTRLAIILGEDMVPIVTEGGFYIIQEDKE